MTTKLHVGNLGRGMTDDELCALFARAGTVVRAHVLTHEQTGKSRGFGHVEMGNEQEARNAVEQLHRVAIAGLRLIVRPVEEFPVEQGARRSTSSAVPSPEPARTGRKNRPE